MLNVVGRELIGEVKAGADRSLSGQLVLSGELRIRREIPEVETLPRERMRDPAIRALEASC